MSSLAEIQERLPVFVISTAVLLPFAGDRRPWGAGPGKKSPQAGSRWRLIIKRGGGRLRRHCPGIR